MESEFKEVPTEVSVLLSSHPKTFAALHIQYPGGTEAIRIYKQKSLSPISGPSDLLCILMPNLANQVVIFHMLGILFSVTSLSSECNTQGSKNPGFFPYCADYVCNHFLHRK